MPSHTATTDRELAPALRALAPERYAAARAAGQAMPLEEVTAYALGDVRDPPDGSTSQT
jgi:hypothetical protein